MVGIFFVLLPVQTQYLFVVPEVGGFVWEQGVVRLYLMEIFLAALLLWYAAHGLFSSISRRTWFGIAAALVFFAVWSLVPHHFSLRGWLLFVHLASAVAVGVFASAAARQYGVQVVLGGFLLGALVAATLGMYQYLTQTSPGSVLFGMSYHGPEVHGDAVVAIGDSRILRTYGPLPHPNIFGGYLVAALLALVVLLPQLSLRMRRIAVGIAMVFLVALVWTYSRSAWIGAGILLAITALEWRQMRVVLPKREVLIGLLVLVAVIVWSWPQITTRLGVAYGTSPLEQRSVQERVQSWVMALPIVRDHWLFGVGIGRYTDMLQQYAPGAPGYQYQPAHVAYALVLAEIGVLGLVFLLLFAWFALRPLSWVWLLPFAAIALFDYYLLAPGVGLFMLTFVIISAKIQYPQQP